jgi:hypothetical protein
VSQIIATLPPTLLRLLGVSLLALSLTGCGTVFLGGIVTRVSPEDYGERLCSGVDLEAYPACMTTVLDYFDQPTADADPPGAGTSGPFAVVMDGGLYLGDYTSIPPFSARFRVDNGVNACRGSYNAQAGSRTSLFDVYCDDGRAGWADIIHDTSGRSGIGRLTLDDGTDGDIIFGYQPLGQAEPYAYGNVWLPQPGWDGVLD